jgi:hypothetical protein
VILKVSTPEFGRVVIDASDGFRYYADLGSFGRVYCYPKTKAEWERVAPDSYGLALVWSTRFEVHVDQVVALASRREALARTG